jgi:hypothetical protein
VPALPFLCLLSVHFGKPEHVALGAYRRIIHSTTQHPSDRVAQVAEQRTFNRLAALPILIENPITTGVATASCGTAPDPFRHPDGAKLAQELAHREPAESVVRGSMRTYAASAVR